MKANKNKLMIVTVGTSLFHSACWDETNNDLGTKLDEFDNYLQMSSDKIFLNSPDERKIRFPSITNFFLTELKFNNANDWANFVKVYSGTIPLMRYSAEISTIINFVKQQENDRHIPWKEILSEYEIVFLHDNHEDNLSYVAAYHNSAYLKTILNLPQLDSNPYSIENLSSKNPGDLIKAIPKLHEFINLQLTEANESGSHVYDEVVMIISGGYKIYGLVGWGFLTHPRFSIAYQHEEANKILIQNIEKLKMGEKFSVPFSPIK